MKKLHINYAEPLAWRKHSLMPAVLTGVRVLLVYERRLLVCHVNWYSLHDRNAYFQSSIFCVERKKSDLI
jgi:hypothetical protein